MYDDYKRTEAKRMAQFLEFTARSIKTDDIKDCDVRYLISISVDGKTHSVSNFGNENRSVSLELPHEQIKAEAKRLCK